MRQGCAHVCESFFLSFSLSLSLSLSLSSARTSYERLNSWRDLTPHSRLSMSLNTGQYAYINRPDRASFSFRLHCAFLVWLPCGTQCISSQPNTHGNLSTHSLSLSLSLSRSKTSLAVSPKWHESEFGLLPLHQRARQSLVYVLFLFSKCKTRFAQNICYVNMAV